MHSTDSPPWIVSHIDLFETLCSTFRNPGSRLSATRNNGALPRERPPPPLLPTQCFRRLGHSLPSERGRRFQDDEVSDTLTHPSSSLHLPSVSRQPLTFTSRPSWAIIMQTRRQLLSASRRRRRRTAVMCLYHVLLVTLPPYLMLSLNPGVWVWRCKPPRSRRCDIYRV